MREGYCSCRVCVSVCLSVCYRSSSFSVRIYIPGANGFLLGFSWILTRGFSKNLPFQSYGVKKPIANELELTASCFRALSGSTKGRTSEAQLVGQVLLERLATGAKQAR